MPKACMWVEVEQDELFTLHLQCIHNVLLLLLLFSLRLLFKPTARIGFKWILVITVLNDVEIYFLNALFWLDF